jgi:hypothetical protein
MLACGTLVKPWLFTEVEFWGRLEGIKPNTRMSTLAIVMLTCQTLALTKTGRGSRVRVDGNPRVQDRKVEMTRRSASLGTKRQPFSRLLVEFGSSILGERC